MSSKYAAKGAIRSVKNIAKGYSDIQVKVREATSNDPWGPPSHVMAEIAEATHDPQMFLEIMDMIDKRLNDHGRNWRHVFKALTLLDYVIHLGSENVVKYARESLYIVRTLKEFQFIDEEGRDQGQNVRQRAKEITALLSDDTRLREERAQRQNVRERMTARSSDEYARDSSYNARGRSSSPSSDRRAASQEDSELQRAIEESKRTAQQDQQRRQGASYSRATSNPTATAAASSNLSEEEQLQRAIELSKKEEEARAGRKSTPNDMIDLFGGNDASIQPYGGGNQAQMNNNSNNNNAPFNDMFGANAQQQPFGQPSFLSSQPTGYMQAQPTGFLQAQPTGFIAPLHTGAAGETNPFGTTFNIGMHQTGISSQPTGMTSQSSGYGNQSSGFVPVQPTGFSNASSIPMQPTGFSAASSGIPLQPTGFMPPQQTGYNPNAQMANIIKNSAVDPFGNLAMQRTGAMPTNLTGGQFPSSDQSAGTFNPFSSNGAIPNDPFGPTTGSTSMGLMQPNKTGPAAFPGSNSAPLVDMDNLMGPSTSSNNYSDTSNVFSKNPFGQSGTDASRRFDWTGGASGQQNNNSNNRTLSELATMQNTGPAAFGGSNPMMNPMQPNPTGNFGGSMMYPSQTGRNTPFG